MQVSVDVAIMSLPKKVPDCFMLYVRVISLNFFAGFGVTSLIGSFPQNCSRFIARDVSVGCFGHRLFSSLPLGLLQLLRVTCTLNQPPNWSLGEDSIIWHLPSIWRIRPNLKQNLGSFSYFVDIHSVSPLILILLPCARNLDRLMSTLTRRKDPHPISSVSICPCPCPKLYQWYSQSVHHNICSYIWLVGHVVDSKSIRNQTQFCSIVCFHLETIKQKGHYQTIKISSPPPYIFLLLLRT